MAHPQPKVGFGGSRPLRIRPHWWAVLAVSLSLLALVAATAPGHSSGPDHRSAVGPSRGTHVKKSPTSVPTSTTTTVPGFGGVTPSGSVPVTTPALPTAAAGATAQVVTRQSTTSATPPAPTTTTTTVAPVGSTVNTTPAQTTQFRTGDLQYPDDSTASFTIALSGAVGVTATWPTSPTLSLSVSCPGGAQTTQGSSGVSVLLPVTGGSCIVTVKELLVQYDTVNYKLTFAPAGG